MRGITAHPAQSLPPLQLKSVPPGITAYQEPTVESPVQKDDIAQVLKIKPMMTAICVLMGSIVPTLTVLLVRRSTGSVQKGISAWGRIMRKDLQQESAE